jgi:putative FmdB family regulatory protein
MSPLFDYACPICGHTENDVFKKFNNVDDLECCPADGAAMDKVVAPPIFMKGDGYWPEPTAKAN